MSADINALGLSVPLDWLAERFADRPNREVGRAVVDKYIDRISSGIGRVQFYVIDVDFDAAEHFNHFSGSGQRRGCQIDD